VECMVKEQENIEQRFKQCEPMKVSGSDWQSFKKAIICRICNTEFDKDRVIYHCYVTGTFRGAVHNDCNINYKFTGRIPVVFLISEATTVTGSYKPLGKFKESH
jgi:hypothetical protein